MNEEEVCTFVDMMLNIGMRGKYYDHLFTALNALPKFDGNLASE